MIPQFDEQYVDYGQNKLIWIFRLRLQDYRFRVLLHSFAVHVPHPSSMYDGYLRSMRTKGKLTEMDLYMKVASPVGYNVGLRDRTKRTRINFEAAAAFVSRGRTVVCVENDYFGLTVP